MITPRPAPDAAGRGVARRVHAWRLPVNPTPDLKGRRAFSPTRKGRRHARDTTIPTSTTAAIQARRNPCRAGAMQWSTSALRVFARRSAARRDSCVVHSAQAAPTTSWPRCVVMTEGERLFLLQRGGRSARAQGPTRRGGFTWSVRGPLDALEAFGGDQALGGCRDG